MAAFQALASYLRTLVYGSPFLCPLEDILDHVSRNIILFGDLQRPQSEYRLSMCIVT